MMLVWSRRSRPGSRFSVMRFWFDLTATPLHTQREQSTSKTWKQRTEMWKDGGGFWAFQILFNALDLMVASMFVQQWDNGLNVIFLDDVQHLRTLNQNTIQHLQDSCHGNINIGASTLVPTHKNKQCTGCNNNGMCVVTWRCFQTIEFTDQPVKIVTEKSTVCTIASDQRSLMKKREAESAVKALILEKQVGF